MLITCESLAAELGIPGLVYAFPYLVRHKDSTFRGLLGFARNRRWRTTGRPYTLVLVLKNGKSIAVQSHHPKRNEWMQPQMSPGELHGRISDRFGHALNTTQLSHKTSFSVDDVLMV